jgi:hypothetical protein
MFDPLISKQRNFAGYPGENTMPHRESKSAKGQLLPLLTVTLAG